MDVVQAASGYVSKMVTTGDSANGAPSAKMKILLLDRETVPCISTAVTQSSLLNHEVYLIDRLDNPKREKMRHLRCLCFVRPHPDSIGLLIDELREPKYGEYHLYFSNVVKKSTLERLAEADDHEVVKMVQEHFLDYVVINADLFSLNMGPPLHRIWSGNQDTWNTDSLQRATEGVIATLLTLKKKPLIRYQKTSLLAKKLATEVRYCITQEDQLFDFRKVDTPPILLILDRREDPITPLLTQWTYQAMVHHLLGIHNGRVDLSSVPDIRPELKEIVLSQDQDPFFKKNMYMNFGDLGGNIKEYVEQYQSKTKNNADIESIADMKRFIEEYPEFRKLSGNVSKHVTLVSELSRRVGSENLLEVSELEQSIACNDNHATDLKVPPPSPPSPISELTLPEHPKPHPIPRRHPRQQGRPRRPLRPPLLQEPRQRPPHAHRPPHDRRRRSSPHRRARPQAPHLPLLPAAAPRRRRRHHGPIRVDGHLWRRRLALQGPQGRRERLHAALAAARDDAAKPHQRQAARPAVPVRRRRRHHARQAAGHCGVYCGRGDVRGGQDGRGYQCFVARRAGGAGGHDDSQCGDVFGGGGRCRVVVA